MMLTPCLILTLLAPAADPPADRHKENFVFKDLTTKGFKVGPETTHKLPAPWMADGLTAKEQTDIITKLSPGVGKPADVLRKGDFKAPMFYKETRIEKADEKAPCYSIDIWFVAYGDLDVMAGDKPEDLFSENPGKSKSKSISDEELKLRNLERKFKEMPLQERWTHTKSVLEKEINVAATTHSIIGLSDESLMVASTLDPSFANDENYPNKWDRKSPLDNRANSGGLSIMGYYMKVTKLKVPKGALFVEIHEVTSEPYDWFKGDTLLRSHFETWAKNEPEKFRNKAWETLPK